MTKNQERPLLWNLAPFLHLDFGNMETMRQSKGLTIEFLLDVKILEGRIKNGFNGKLGHQSG